MYCTAPQPFASSYPSAFSPKVKSGPRLAAALLLPLAACSDLFMESERVPTSLVLADSVLTTVQGRRVELGLTVLDQDGRAMERLPEWAAPVWTSSGAAVQVDGDALVAAAPGQAQATVTVAGLTATARVRVNPPALRLTIPAIQLTQAAQPEGASMPLVARRAAMLRVFLQGDTENFFGPSVRVKVYHGDALVRTLAASADAIPTSIDPAKAAESWNVAIPAELVVPGMRVLVEADPEGRVPLLTGSTTTYPASGVPLAADVREVPPFYVRMIPIHQAASGTTGFVNAQNLPQFLRPLMDMLPVEQVHADLHAPFTTANAASTSEGWSAILREVAALRAAEGARRYYYGVVRRAGGPSGIGYLGTVPAALGWDALPNAAQTMAHELGHNFNRQHAPCGGPSGVDRAFPTGDASLDVHGWNVRTGEVMAQRAHYDLMSYCEPEWITAYTWRNILDFRIANDGARGAQSAAPQPVLLVWGSVRDGQVVLEPAFELTAPVALPERPGPYRLETRDGAGALLSSISFDGVEVMDGVPGERHFAFAIPRAALRLDQAAELRLSGAGAHSVRLSRLPPAGSLQLAAPRFSMTRTDAGGRPGVSVDWDAERHPMVMVRDPGTGQVLSFARGGRMNVRTDAAALDLLFSDGVRTTSRRVQVR